MDEFYTWMNFILSFQCLGFIICKMGPEIYLSRREKNCIHSSNKYLLSIYYVPDMISDAQDSTKEEKG
jgi:hypothetical protein